MVSNTRHVVIKLRDVSDLRSLVDCALVSVVVTRMKATCRVALILRLGSGGLVSAPIVDLASHRLGLPGRGAKWKVTLDAQLNAIRLDAEQRAEANPVYIATEKLRMRRLAQRRLDGVRKTIVALMAQIVDHVDRDEVTSALGDVGRLWDEAVAAKVMLS